MALKSGGLPAVLAVLFTGVLLSACNSGGGSASTEPTATPTATATATPTATAAPTATPTPTPTGAIGPTPTPPVAALGHPRLWLTASDLPRLRGLAVSSNPYWEDGFKQSVQRAVNDMDSGSIAGDCGDVGYTEYPTESYAAFFAFASLVAPEAQRANYAQRARTLLMTIINEADKGPATQRNFSCDGNQQYPRFRHPDFATEDRDRARYHGEAFALTVDWIYSSLSSADRAAIRRVFLRWSNEIVNRGYRHPEPVGLLNSPTLYADKYQRRFSGNNYYGAHMRNLGLMALALDAADDAGGQLRAYLNTATGAYFYIFRELVRVDSAGGLLPEGFEYSPQTAAYHLQFLLALNTAGAGDADATAIDSMPFWSDYVTAYLHSLSPGTVVREESRGAEYLPAFYGDAQDYQLPDFVNSFAALGIYDQRSGGNPTRLNAARWAVLNTPAGGAAGISRRISNPADYREAILYFMVLDPAVTPTDPRPALATRYYASGPGRMFARSGWNANASWFTYALSWNSVDHQNAEGNSFAMFRKGEWLTKTTLGYADIGESVASTEYANGLCIENDRPDRDLSDYRTDLWRRGSQWYLGSDDAPVVLARSFGSDYAYALGDATTLYNSTNESSTDVLLANRSIVWLHSDRVFVFDRAQTRTANRFKRFWLQLPNPATISGNRATARTDGGQSLGVTSVLPSGALLASVTGDAYDAEIERKIANNEPMTARLSITAPGNPQIVRFLTVLQGADSTAQLASVNGFASGDGAWQGAAVATDAVIFPATLGTAGAFTLSLPAGVARVLVTGLTPNAGYSVTRNGNGLTLAVGGSARADAGGVVEIR